MGFTKAEVPTRQINLSWIRIIVQWDGGWKGGVRIFAISDWVIPKLVWNLIRTYSSLGYNF